jgi:hypothetical protein
LTRSGKSVKQSPGLIATTAYRAITLLAILIAWVLFRAENIDTFTTLLTDMVSSSSTEQLKLLYCCRRTEFDFLLNSGAFMQLPVGELWQIKFYQDLVLLSMGALICLFLPNAMELFQRHQVAIDADSYVRPRTGTFMQWHASPLWATSFGILLFLSVMQLSQLAPFLYFQF